MKTLSLLLFPLWLHAAQITVSFNYNFTGTTPCTPTVTANCLEKFEVGILSGAVFNTLTSIPLPANPIGAVNGIGGAFQYNGSYGQVTLSAIVVARDAAGNRITSDPTKATVSVLIPPNTPTGISIVVQ